MSHFNRQASFWTRVKHAGYWRVDHRPKTLDKTQPLLEQLFHLSERGDYLFDQDDHEGQWVKTTKMAEMRTAGTLVMCIAGIGALWTQNLHILPAFLLMIVFRHFIQEHTTNEEKMLVAIGKPANTTQLERIEKLLIAANRLEGHSVFDTLSQLCKDNNHQQAFWTEVEPVLQSWINETLLNPDIVNVVNKNDFDAGRTLTDDVSAVRKEYVL